MGIPEILVQIDGEIARLKQARALLSGSELAGRRGRIVAAKPPVTKKRNLTPEGRRRIAEAVRRRWARQKGQSISAA